MRLVVVGGDAAGMTAASLVHRRRPDASVVVVERSPYTSYSMCGLPFYVGAEIDDAQDLVVRTPEQFRRDGIDVRTRTEALAIDAERRRVRVRDLERDTEEDVAYDALLYAAGAHPIVPPLTGLAEYGHVVHTLDEAEHLRGHLDAREEHGDPARRVVVIGAGYIGIEIAEALVRRGLDATVIDRLPQVLGALDEDMAGHVEEALRRFGVAVRLGESVQEVVGRGGRCAEVVTDRARYPADVVVLAVGAKPNVAIAADAGCAVGATGALVVDHGMRTTVDGIWAAGDCVESRHVLTGEPVNIQLGTHANKQGKVAALTIVGEEAAFPGVVGTAVTKVCQWEVARTGLNEREARTAGVGYAAVTFSTTSRAGYMPEPGRVLVKMLAEERTGRLLGVQLVGTGCVAKRIDAAATWCQLGVAVQDIQFLDLAYAPPFGSVWDLLQAGARKLVAELGLHPVL